MKCEQHHGDKTEDCTASGDDNMSLLRQQPNAETIGL